VSEYDNAGRLAGLKNQASGLFYGGATATDPVNRIQYASHGSVKAMKLGNGKWHHTNFNERLQPIEIGLGANPTDSSILRLDYGYGATNNNGNVLSQRIVVSGAMDVRQDYGYDSLNRLWTASEFATSSGAQQWQQTYDYDRWGNRAVNPGSMTIPNPILTPQLLTDFNTTNNRIQKAGFGYDVTGNLTKDPTTAPDAMVYDGENKQVSYTKASLSTTYSYDGDGHRVKKVENPGSPAQVTTLYVYNAGGQLIAEYSTSTASPPGGGGTSYLTTDHLGSTRVVTKQDGSVKARYDYLPFGEELGAGSLRTVPIGYSAADATRQKFTQKERDAESGLDYFLARYYSSAQGRFTSSDPTLLSVNGTNPQTWNRYAYVLNNPLLFVDPLGLWAFEFRDEKDSEGKIVRRNIIFTKSKKGDNASTLVKQLGFDPKKGFGKELLKQIEGQLKRVRRKVCETRGDPDWGLCALWYSKCKRSYPSGTHNVQRRRRYRSRV
jgi:RHS repeat-associated protein